MSRSVSTPGRVCASPRMTDAVEGVSKPYAVGRGQSPITGSRAAIRARGNAVARQRRFPSTRPPLSRFRVLRHPPMGRCIYVMAN